MKNPESKSLFAKAQETLVGGVNSPVRAFKAVGETPLFIESAKGAVIRDADGNSYTDFVGSWGPMILGHAHPKVVSAVKLQASKGTSFGAPTELEIKLGLLVKNAFPSIEKVRFVSSGTEAAMTAIRLARAFTQRDKIVKFEGCYHGHSDAMLVKAGSGAATLGTPDSAGVPKSVSEDTLVLPYNDVPALQNFFKDFGPAIAGVIVEPVAANMGLVPPEPGFLEALREVTKKHGAVLIFDEVISGFRLDFGGAQTLYKISPDLTCLGKIVGGGLPVGAVGGRKEILDLLAPLGPVYQAGTLSGNPLAMAAGIKTLEELKARKPYKKLEAETEKLCNTVRAYAKWLKRPVQIHQLGSMFTIFFTDKPVRDYASAKTSNTETYARFFRSLLDAGIYFPPSQFETCFISAAHTPAILKASAKNINQSLEKLNA